jgi:hypothetical protein
VTASDRVAALKFALSRGALGRHRRHMARDLADAQEKKNRDLTEAHAMLASREAAVAREREKARTPMPTVAVSFATREDVRGELQFLYGSAKQDVLDADRVGDKHLAERSRHFALKVVDLVCRFEFGMSRDGVSVDASTKVVNLFGGLSDDEKRQYLNRLESPALESA